MDAKTADRIAWPKKTRDFHNHHIDSTRWDDFPFRDDDIVIATWGKSGTTWTQQIVGQLVLDGAEGLMSGLSPWVEMRTFPKDEVMKGLGAQTNRRYL